EAAAYCRWLSEQEGVPEDQMVYPPVKEIMAGAAGEKPLRLPANHLSRCGDRLPTEGEWGFAGRAGAAPSRYYGSSVELLSRYAWSIDNAEGERAWPVGQKRPNDLGLFDMHGNVFTWCHESYAEYPKDGHQRVVRDQGDNADVTDKVIRVLRG